MPIKIFISHNIENDSDKMKRLTNEINTVKGLEAVAIKNKPTPGVLFADQVIKGMGESKYFVPILTSSSVHSIWVNQEIGYARAKDMIIYPLIDDSLLNDVGGFIHKDEEHFTFKSEGSKRKESWSFKKTCLALINHIKEFEGLKGHIDISTYHSAVTQGKENKENSHIEPLTKDTELKLIVIVSQAIQEFVVYVSFVTVLGEQWWIGFTNLSEYGDNKSETEYIFDIGEPEGFVKYEIKCNLLEYITKSGLSNYYSGTPIGINKIRFRSDTPVQEPIHFYYSFDS